MPVAAPLIIGGLSAAGAIGGAAIGSSASQSAANTQAHSADQAIALQREQWQQQQQNIAPWLDTGKNALGQLSAGMPGLTAGFDPTQSGLPASYGSFQAPDAFQAPAPFTYNGSDFYRDPGYQAAMDQANKAIQRSAAAHGDALGGSTLKALSDYNTGAASQYYNQAYQRAQGTYQQNFSNAQGAYQQNFGNQLAAYGANQGTYQQNFGNAFNTYETTQGNAYNRLAALAGVGQTAAQQMGAAGSAYATNAGNMLMSQGNALAAGQVGSANAWNGALGGMTNNMMNLYMASKMFGSGYGQPPSLGVQDLLKLGIST